MTIAAGETDKLPGVLFQDRYASEAQTQVHELLNETPNSRASCCSKES